MKTRTVPALLFALIGGSGLSAQVPAGGEFQVNSYTASDQATPAVASDLAGNFIVAWQSYGQDGSCSGVLGLRGDCAGVTGGGRERIDDRLYGPLAGRIAATAPCPGSQVGSMGGHDAVP